MKGIVLQSPKILRVCRLEWTDLEFVQEIPFPVLLTAGRSLLMRTASSVEANTGHNNANGHLCSSFRFLAKQQEVVVVPIVGKFHDKLSYATSSFSITNHRTV